MKTKATVALGSTDYEMVGIVRGHKVIIDEPTENGGQDKGPDPTEYLCIALASCTVATLKMYINHKKLTVDKISVEVDKITTEDKKNIFKRKLHIEGPFDAAIRERLVQIANACPVHKILSQANTVETELM
ncbi:MAG: OsmC family protein [Bacteroidia bacterium]